MPWLQLAAAGTTLSPALASGGGPDISVWRIVLALLLCLALAGTAAWLLRRRMGGGLPVFLRRPDQARLRMVERIALGAQASVALIEIDGRELLVVSAPNAVTVVPVELMPVTIEAAS